MYYRHTQGNIFMPLGFVITVGCLECAIQFVCKMLNGCRGLVKLNQPFMCAIAVIREIKRGCCIIVYYSTGFFAGYRNSFIGILYNYFFSKSIDEMLDAPAYLDAEGIQ